METHWIEFAGMLVRWLHVIAGIAWIGSSFYFIWLDRSLEAPEPGSDEARKGVGGHLWAVHGGGFYNPQKYTVAPARLPERLHWFKWEAYTTWLSGTALLFLVYWLHAGTMMLDPSKGDQAPWQAVALGAECVLDAAQTAPTPLVGGGTHDPLFRQLLADATGRSRDLEQRLALHDRQIVGKRMEGLHEQAPGPRLDVGIVFQQPTLLPWQTVLDNVLLPIRTLGMDEVAGRKRALELLELVGLAKFASHYPNELSGGMQQRVGIARGIIHDPKLLLMDEPFAALDAMSREHMMIELQRIWLATKKSVVFITHSIPEAVYLSNRVVVMSPRPGRITEVVNVNLGANQIGRAHVCTPVT